MSIFIFRHCDCQSDESRQVSFLLQTAIGKKKRLADLSLVSLMLFPKSIDGDPQVDNSHQPVPSDQILKYGLDLQLESDRFIIYYGPLHRIQIPWTNHTP